MSQDFYPNFTSTEQVYTTMQNLIESNLDSLRTKFSGATAPATTEQFQWWADTTSGILKIRNEADGAWINVYDLDNEEIIIDNDQITAAMIAAATRKPTIIEGEDIGPATCSIRTKFTGSSLLNMPIELFTKVSTLGEPTVTGTWETILNTKIYIPDDVETLYVLGYQGYCTLRFRVASTYSGNSTEPGTPPAWGSEINVDVSAMSGWQDLDIDVLSSDASPPYDGLHGLVMRFGE